MRKALIIAASIAASSLAAAQTGPACTAVENDMMRLICYDLLFGRTPTPAAPAKTPPPIRWSIEQSRSPVDDSEGVTALLDPAEISYSGVGDAEARLMLRCREGKTDVAISVNDYLSEKNVSVTTRVDSLPAEEGPWWTSTSRHGIGLWSAAFAVPFINRIADGATLFVRIEERNRTDLRFDLVNVRDAAEAVATACGWRLD